MKIKADLHNHLRTSSRIVDGDFNKAVDIARQRLGYEGLLGMCNFEDDRYERLIGLKGGYNRSMFNEGGLCFVPEKSLMIVKGQEVPTKQGHLLVLGIPAGKHLRGGRDINDSVDEARDLGGIVIADHPFYAQGSGDFVFDNYEIARHIDAVEVFNGEAAFTLPFLGSIFPRRANERAQYVYAQYLQSNPGMHLGAISASDGHSFKEIGNCWTELEVHDKYNRYAYKENLRKAIRATDLMTASSRKRGWYDGFRHVALLAMVIALEKGKALSAKRKE